MKALLASGITLLSLLPFNLSAQMRFYNDSLYSSKYQCSNGMLNGTYVSYYKNGVKKSEGNFEFNNRIGEWSVWDTAGKLKVKRVYKNPYEFTKVYPEVDKAEKGAPMGLLSKPPYKLERDSAGCWKKFLLNERMVAYSQRNFKCFYTSDKQLFFNCKTLFTILYQNALNNNYHVYATDNGNEDINYKTRIDVATIDTSKIKLVGFRIKSDYVFDNARFLTEDIPLFITVLVTDKTNPKDTSDLFNVYMPETRKYFARVELTANGRPLYLDNLDDVFFFGCYSERKWKVNNPSGMNDKYSYTPASNVNKDLIKEVEKENNLWLYFNK